MKRSTLLAGAALALSSSLVLAQGAPESLLPPGFDDPAPAPSPAPAPRPTAAPTAAPAPGQPGTSAPASGAVVQPLPDSSAPAVPSGPIALPDNLPSLQELEDLSTDELDELLGLRPKFDIPPAARRSVERVGLLSESEGGLPAGSLGRQPAALVRAALDGTQGPMVSRWGHILMRRALVSRLASPEDMDPIEFANLRAGLLNRMGEYAAARALVQDIDAGNWNRALTDTALDSYVGTNDIVGACPAVRVGASDREDGQWRLLQAICNAYAGEVASAGTDLNRAFRNKIAPEIDILLAQRFAGAAGRGRRAVNIEWDNVEDMTPWRYALALSLGIEIPANLVPDNDPYYRTVSATAPMLPLPDRVDGAAFASRRGILSSRAMIDFYSQVYAAEGIEGEPAVVAARLRDAYVTSDPAGRLQALRDIWGANANIDYARLVLTAYAAARMPASDEFTDDAAPLISSMLAAGLDRDALRWGAVVPEGSAAWAMLALAQPNRSNPVDGGAIDSFVDDDESASQRKSQFLLAGLAGLGRIEAEDRSSFSERLGVDLDRRTRWSELIDQAAAVNNRALVAYLAGVGMQGDGWDKMTARHLYHIVAALNRVGLDAEARMIAAEAVARG